MVSRLHVMYRTTLAALVVLSAACGASPEGPAADAPASNAGAHLDAPYVVLVSFDGFGAELLDVHPSPAFDRVGREGVRAERMIPTYPTKTFPTHYSMATGMYAENHGLVGNTFWAPDKQGYYRISDREVVEDGSWYRGEPIWVTAETQGMVAASFFFVGTEADVQGVRPTYWRPFDASVPNRERVDQVLDWLSLPQEHRPHMVTLYFEDVDAAWHNHGRDSDETAAAVREVDQALGRLLSGLDSLPHGDRVYLLLVADHGLMPAPAALVAELDMALFPGVRFITGGPYASLVIDEGGAERAAALRDSIAVLLPDAEVLLREEVPARYHYSTDPRIGDIVILAAPGRRVVRAGSPYGDSHTHGWDNRLPEMGAIFLARGPGIEAGSAIGAFEAIHLYPFMAHVLGLDASSSIDGDLEVLLPILGPGSN